MNLLLILTVGLPRSGKSTWARRYILDHPGTVIVNPDAIRLALHGQRYCPDAEPMVWTVTRYMVKSLFNAGHHTIILDATNTNAARRKQWASADWKTVVHVVSTDADECAKRALETGQNDLIEAGVITRMLKDLAEPENAKELRDYEWV